MFCHKWSKNCKTTIPNKCIFFDCETYINQVSDTIREMPLRLGYAIYHNFRKGKQKEKRQVHYFETWEGFYDFVLSHINKKERLCLWAHNMQFDIMTSQFYYLAFLDGWRSRIPYCKGGVYLDSVSKDGMKIDIIDTYNLFKCRVKDLGNALNFPKGDVDFEANEYIPTEILKPYCLRDVEILEKTMESWFTFLTDNDLGHAQRTIASQASGTYRHKFMAGDIWVHAKKQPVKLERLSYFGGRVECFEIGHIKTPIVYKLDINSMYPYVMHKNLLPHAFVYVKKTMSISKLITQFQKYSITANCFIDTNEPAYPKRINKKLCFPIGRFWTTLSTPEIKHALIYNHLLKVEQIEAHKQAPIFKEFINFMYTERLKYKKLGNKAWVLFLKYLMNSAYGKTGQKQRVTIEKDIEDLLKVDEQNIIDGDTGEISTLITFGGRQIERTTTEEDAFNAYPAIAAHITAFARMYLFDLLQKAGRENCFYCDTDSLFTNKQGYINLKEYISDTELGLLKIEETTDHLVVNGNKDYIFGDKVTLKGIKSNAIKINDNTYQFYQWTRFHSIFKYGLRAPVQQILSTKVLKREYDKGRILKTGRVMPFKLDEPIDTCPFDC